METKVMKDVRHLPKVPGIYLSEHETFRSGNIARGGVIETISRKAISPLAPLTTIYQSTKIYLPLLPVRDWDRDYPPNNYG